MRTTLSLDDDVVEIAKDYAAVRNLSLGAAVSELVRKGIEAPLRVRLVNGLYVADLPPDSPVVTAERVKELMDEEF
jgi:Family of unknown function (DUF6364)